MIANEDINKKKNRTIAILSVALFLCLIIIGYLYIRKGNVGFDDTKTVTVYIAPIGPVEYPIARENVLSFRNYNLGSGIYYDTSEIQHYVKDVFPALMNAEIDWCKSKSLDISGYTWKIGCYFMLNKDTRNSLNKMDFFFVPTLVKLTDKNSVLDYFNSKDSIYYNPALNINIPNQPSNITSGVFNTGTMFP